MIEIGRLCVKTAGRDAGKKCIIIDILDNKFVLIDGETRRRKCNTAHIEPLEQIIGIKKGASHADVAAEFAKLGLTARETKAKAKKARPRKLRISKLAKKPEQKAEQKATVKKEAETAVKKKVKKAVKKKVEKE